MHPSLAILTQPTPQPQPRRYGRPSLEDRAAGLLPPMQQAVIDALTDAGREGLLQFELQVIVGLNMGRLSQVLNCMKRLGSIYAEQEEGDSAIRRRNRWRLARYRPVPRPDLGTSYAAARSGTLSDPFGVRHVPRVIDPAQCRPWAAAASSARSAA